MVMPSTITHVRRSLNKTLGLFLDSQDIMNELLKEFEPDVAKDFINIYVNQYDENNKRVKDGKKINIVTTVPQEVVDLDNTILVDMGGGRESEEGHSIGNIINTYDYDGADTASTEHTTLTYNSEEEYAMVKSAKPIGDLLDIEEIFLEESQISYIDNKTIRLDIPYEQAYELGIIGNPLDVTLKYMPSTGNDYYGVVRGYDVTETVRLVIMSKNLNTLRILDMLVKASLIIMRSMNKESETYKLAEAEYFDTAPLSEAELPGLPGRVFGRQVEITYTVTYGMDQKVTKFLSSIDTNLLK